uniref:Uncharacterized protein n=1 Tax=Nymphaea colorata TaxID=210225 RepID=A0A5K1BZL3_9MAGN
MHRAGSDTRWT